MSAVISGEDALETANDMGLGRVEVDRLDPVGPCEELALSVSRKGDEEGAEVIVPAAGTGFEYTPGCRGASAVTRQYGCHRSRTGSTYHLELFSRRSKGREAGSGPSRSRGGGGAENEKGSGGAEVVDKSCGCE